MGGVAGLGSVDRGAEGVEPSVDSDAAFFSFRDEKREGVVAGGGALGACQVAAPGLERRGVEGAAFRADLDEEVVDACAAGGFEERNDFLFLGFLGESRFAREVQVPDRGHPGTAKLLGKGGRESGEKEEKEEERKAGAGESGAR